MTTEYLIFVALGFSAALVSAIFGFGTALIVLAVGAHILPVKETIALATVLFAASTISKSVLFSRHIDWKLVSLMTVASLPFTYLGASLLNDIPADVLRRLLGFMVLCYIGFSWSGTMIRWKPQTAGLIAGSATYGFFSGLLGSGNIIKVILFRETRFSKEAFVGAMAATSVLANVVKLMVFSKSGLLHAGLKNPMIALVTSAIVAALLGRYCLKKLTVSQFDVGLRWVLGISAVGLLL